MGTLSLPLQPAAVPCTHSPARSHLSRWPVEIGKISLVKLCGRSHGSIWQFLIILPGILPDAVVAREGEGNPKTAAHQHDRIGEFYRAGVHGLGRDQRKWRPGAGLASPPRVVVFTQRTISSPAAAFGQSRIARKVTDVSVPSKNVFARRRPQRHIFAAARSAAIRSMPRPSTSALCTRSKPSSSSPSNDRDRGSIARSTPIRATATRASRNREPALPDAMLGTRTAPVFHCSPVHLTRRWFRVGAALPTASDRTRICLRRPDLAARGLTASLGNGPISTDQAWPSKSPESMPVAGSRIGEGQSPPRALFRRAQYAARSFHREDFPP